MKQATGNIYNILIFENDADSIQLMQRYFVSEMFKLHIADMKIGITHNIKSTLPDIVLISSQIKELSPYDICKKIRLNDLFANVPIIFIFSNQEEFDKSFAYSMGCSDYIIKPIDKQEIVRKVNNLITINNLEKQLNKKDIAYDNKEQKQIKDVYRLNEYLKTLNRELIEKTILIKHSEQRILNAIIQTQEEERTRLAKELHDGVSPLLSIIKNNVVWLNTASDNDKDLILKNTIESLNMALKSIKEISNNLSPHILNNLGLIPAISKFIENIILEDKVEIIFKTNIIERLPQDIEINLYRIAIECINNTLKHANANAINIQIERLNYMTTLEYYDNGIGFNKNNNTFNRGMGLINIENRVKAMRGNIVIKTSEGKGFYMLIKC